MIVNASAPRLAQERPVSVPEGMRDAIGRRPQQLAYVRVLLIDLGLIQSPPISPMQTSPREAGLRCRKTSTARTVSGTFRALEFFAFFRRTVR
jgi:hypothetical protein